ncbi:MAG: GNAT family N-acetyltransferase [Myxococcales bacterium]|nr:GNAT family N-acetyltransferase [Myxococcales bacterium]USN51140.1 MAG: GNAT family N-acetyltransferase [Myxococcales bacterium]
MKKTIEHQKNPSDIDISFLTQNINHETSEHGEAFPFAFFIKDNNKKIIAGANGFVIYGSIYTDQLWVQKEYRGQGYAKEIMENIHKLGRQNNCRIATIQTMNFQNAKKFYESLGYKEDFKRLGYINDSYCIFMKKLL